MRARNGSSRLPGKALLTAGGRTYLAHTVDRIAASPSIGKVVVATTEERDDDAVEEHCSALGVACFRGSAEDVLDRVYRCAAEHGMEAVAHFGSDNPLIDPATIDQVASVYEAVDGLDYVTNNRPPTWPDGLEVEITSTKALERVWKEAPPGPEREHILLRIWDRPDEFRMLNVERSPNLHAERWTLDYDGDHEFLQAVFEALGDRVFAMDEVLALLEERPELRELNAEHRGDYPWLEER